MSAFAPAMLNADDLEALAYFLSLYPTWWYKIGVCAVSRDFDCAPQAHSPEIRFIENGQWPDNCFSCDHAGSVAAAIYDVLGQIAAAEERI